MRSPPPVPHGQSLPPRERPPGKTGNHASKADAFTKKETRTRVSFSYPASKAAAPAIMGLLWQKF
jgi:hypothetical protein